MLFLVFSPAMFLSASPKAFLLFTCLVQSAQSSLGWSVPAITTHVAACCVSHPVEHRLEYTNHKYAGQPNQDWIMWTRRTGKSLSDRAGQRAFLGEGGAGTRSQKQGQVAGTEQGARPRESPGARREAPPGDTAHRKAGSAESHTHPPLGCGSSAVAGGLLRGTCSLDVRGDGER